MERFYRMIAYAQSVIFDTRDLIQVNCIVG